MSFEAAVGKIDQILQWQQQIQDPTGAAQATSTGGAGLTGATGTSSGTAFADALATAQAGSAQQAIGASGTAVDPTSLLSGGNSQLASLLSSATGATGSGGSLGSTVAGMGALTGATGPEDPRVVAMTNEANSLLGKPYVWGGGHGGWGPQAGYDCSGFVSAVLHAGGYLSTPQDTTTLPSAPGMEQGPGQYVTVYDRSQPGENGHVIIEINGQFYESGGAQGAWGGGGGVERIGTPSAAYLATFDTVLHPAGL